MLGRLEIFLTFEPCIFLKKVYICLDFSLNKYQPMQSLIIPFVDIDTVQDIINLLRRHKQAFEIKDIEPSLLDDPNIVWEFSEPDTDWQN